jgi:hypothetical protein
LDLNQFSYGGKHSNQFFPFLLNNSFTQPSQKFFPELYLSSCDRLSPHLAQSPGNGRLILDSIMNKRK